MGVLVEILKTTSLGKRRQGNANIVIFTELGAYRD